VIHGQCCHMSIGYQVSLYTGQRKQLGNKFTMPLRWLRQADVSHANQVRTCCHASGIDSGLSNTLWLVTSRRRGCQHCGRRGVGAPLSPAGRRDTVRFAIDRSNRWGERVDDRLLA
jgi:hypothetical protein